MTKDEFEWAWNQSPSPAVAELFSHKDAIVRVEKPLDRRWYFMGATRGSALDWMVPCDCQRPDLKLWVKGGPPIPSKSTSVTVCCRGAKWHNGAERGWIYAGKCHECGKVYWLTKE